jgi:hypothetical protein
MQVIKRAHAKSIWGGDLRYARVERVALFSGNF